MSDTGIICILANFNTPEMRKVMDFKVTTSYPTITFPKDFTISFPQLSQTVEGYQHLTIPPDLNLHLTGNGKPKIWLESFDGLVDDDGKLTKEYQKLITVVFPPISDFPVFTGKKYNGVMIIGFEQLPHWNENTSFVLELFAMKEDNRNVPKESHYAGDLGTYMPFKYADMGKTFDEPKRQGNFYILPFAVTNHDLKPAKQMTVYFGDNS